MGTPVPMGSCSVVVRMGEVGGVLLGRPHARRLGHCLLGPGAKAEDRDEGLSYSMDTGKIYGFGQSWSACPYHNCRWVQKEMQGWG